MKRPAVLFGVALAGVAAVVIGTNALHAQSEPAKQTVLLKASLKKIRRAEGTVLLAELSPGAETGKHDHRGYELAYVINGSATLEVDGEAPVSLKAGEAFYQPMRQVHNVKNASATDPAKVLMVLIEQRKEKKRGGGSPASHRAGAT